MTDRAKIFTIAHLPEQLCQAWLQHLRDFDTKNPDCHFEVVADLPTVSVRDMVEMVKLNPALKFSEIIERGKQ